MGIFKNPFGAEVKADVAAAKEKGEAKALAKATDKLAKFGGPTEGVVYAVEGLATDGKDVVGVLYVLENGTVGFEGKNGAAILGSKSAVLNVQGVSVTSGAVLSKIDLQTPTGPYRIKNVASSCAKNMAAAINNRNNQGA